ncbi:MAG: NAD(P)-dependent oxidoreductase [Erysipelotrichaceae bacterium]|nr:NAD(P)-dependent oxidoreductase [Erysipelotrichaceae bacterium]
MKKVVITGSTGMIGLALTKILIKEKVECLLIVRKNSTKLDKIPNDDLIKVVECDLNELKQLEYPESDFDAFFHLGWDATIGNGRDNVYLQKNNIEYTLDAVALAKRLGCKTFVGTGSQAEYGIKFEMLTAETPCVPLTGYGIAKYSAGMLSRLYCNQIGIKHCWARILSIFGENDNPNTLISYVINSLNNGISPMVTKCEQDWDYLYVDDCANALKLIAQFGINNKVYPIGSGRTRKLYEYLEDIKLVYNSNIEIGYGKKDYNPNQVMYLCANIDELSNDTGFTPKYSFIDAIKKIKNNN